MNGIKFKIQRFDDGNIENRPIKIIGFNVLNDKEDQSIYRETVLSSDDFNGKTPEQCVDFAFNKLSSSLAESANVILTSGQVLGSYYIPN